MGVPLRQSFAGMTQGLTVSDVFNQALTVDRNMTLKVGQIIGNDPSYNRQPDYYLNVFSMSPAEFIRHRPVDFPTIKIGGCPPGQPWHLAVRIPNYVGFKIISAETGQPSFTTIKGERFATDLLNPANLGENIWLDVTNTELDQFHGAGDDLTRRGVWWEKGSDEATPGPRDVPTAQGIAWAKQRMERHYHAIVQQAKDLATQGKLNEIGQEPHIAADYLHVSETWHIRTSVGISCPNCGDIIQPGVAYHVSQVGGVCVLDWKRCCAAGVKTREQVPSEMRWWSDEPEQSNGDAEKRGPGRPRKE